MKLKKIWFTCLLAGAVMLCACGKKPAVEEVTDHSSQSEDSQQGTQEEITEDVTKSDAEDASEEKQTLELRNLEVLVDSYYESEKHPTEEYLDVAVAEYPMIYLGQEDAKQFPDLEKTLEAANTQRQTQSRESLKQLKESYDEFAADMNDEDINYSYYYSDEIKAKVLRADTRVLSIESSYYGFSGGAHGYYGFGGYNYDTQTGKELALTDVVTDTNQLFALLTEKLPEEYPDVNFVDLDTYFKELVVSDVNWSIGFAGLKVYFNPYELASYAEGEQIIFIPFAENPDLFVAQYTQVPEFYVTPVLERETYYIDANADGKLEPFSLWGRSENEEGTYYWDVKVADQTFSTDDDYSFFQESYLVHANGTDYLYLFETRENDYSILKVIDLKEMKQVDAGSENMNLSPYSSWKDEVTTYHILNNPNDMLLESRMNAMSTYSGLKHYFIGDNGIPYAEEPLYSTEFAYVLTAKQDIECQIVDINGVVLEENAIIPEGSYLRIVRTDGMNIVEMLMVDPDQVYEEGEDDYKWKMLKDTSVDLENATIYRIQTYESEDEDAWEILLNGKPAYDQFDGIMFAG